MNRLEACIGGALCAILAACAAPAPERIVAYDVPYTGKWAPAESIRPEPRPTVTAQRRWPACDKWPDDCGLSFTPPPEHTPIRGAGYPPVPPLDFTPELPQPEVEPEPETQPEPEKPAKEWGPA